MPVVSIRHSTTYRYRVPVGFGEHRMMLRPLESFDQRLLACDIEISPEPSVLRELHDASGACLGLARFATAADRLVIESRVRIDHRPCSPLDDGGEPASLAAGAAFDYAAEEAAALAVFRRRLHPDAGETALWARRFVRGSGATPVLRLLTEMTHAIRAEFAYALRLRGSPQTPAETLALRQGSCRDFAVLMVEAARSLGLAAQFVSGYIYSSSAKAGRTGGGHTHAWTRVYVPGCGWVDFDPTNAIVGNHDLIRVAVVTDPRTALPLHGTWQGEPGAFLGMEVEVDLLVEAETQLNRHLRIAQAR